MNINTDYRTRVSAIFRDSRATTDISQEQMAAELGVNRKTISKWENGQSVPDIYQTTEWFRVLGIPPLPYIFAYLYPHLDNELEPEGESTREYLHNVIDSLHSEDVRGLFYLLYGNHGSAPHSVIQLILAHLHCPMDFRVSHAKMILSNYELCQSKGTLVDIDKVPPELDNLNDAINQGFNAAVENKNGYISKVENE